MDARSMNAPRSPYESVVGDGQLVTRGIAQLQHELLQQGDVDRGEVASASRARLNTIGRAMKANPPLKRASSDPECRCDYVIGLAPSFVSRYDALSKLDRMRSRHGPL